MRDENLEKGDIQEMYKIFLQQKKINDRDRKIDEILGNIPKKDEFLDFDYFDYKKYI
jgi:hypothetical protein